ncbi:MAG: PDZ domain-containing protein [Anaerolineae bacterium]|nr:PDZ domain-containing protein [Anaerolineae bacterium]
MKKKLFLLHGVLILSLILSGCGVLPQALGIAKSYLGQQNALPGGPTPLAQQPTPAATQSPPLLPPASSGSALAALQGTLESIYEVVSPSVVNIQVIIRQETPAIQLPQMPFGFGFPFFEETPSQPRQQMAEGSGFVWDTDGHIVTNNHVVEGADSIQVTFADGRIYDAELVGNDPDADLAVIKIDAPADSLQPLALADSDTVKVGQLAVAIGNPFGLSGTMTVGFISALGRSLEVGDRTGSGVSYTIPDIIQTDAPINPGNSGGVLVNERGQVIGVPTAIESPVRANAGIGFAIPSNIVQRVVPVLIEKGFFEHAWLGISGTTLTPTLAKAMDLDENQRGVLVIEVTPNSPADKAGLRGSDRQKTINGQEVRIGGDVILAIEGEPLQRFDDLVSYLFRKGEAGQSVALKILRDGREKTVQVELAARPGTQQKEPNQSRVSGRVWIGFQGVDLTPELAQAMGLEKDQRGVLVQRVMQDSPADKAGLRGSFKPLTVDGREVLIGGDVIVAVNGEDVASMKDLKAAIGEAQAGDVVKLSLLREGERLEIEITLEETPTAQP